MANYHPFAQEIQRLGPILEDAMQYYPGMYGRSAEGFRLCFSACGFASRVLEGALLPNFATELQAGVPVDDANKLPGHMAEEHVLLDIEGNKADATWRQWFYLFGLDPYMVEVLPEVGEIYPKNQIAIIPAGEEKQFGERFVDYALDVSDKLEKLRQTMGRSSLPRQPQLGRGYPDLKVGSEEALHIVADIWNPKRYKPFSDTQGEDAVEKAISFVRAKSS